MKNLELNAYGVSEMDITEMQTLQGGWLIPFLIGSFAGGLIYDLVFHTGDTANSYNKGAAQAMEDFNR